MTTKTSVKETYSFISKLAITTFILSLAFTATTAQAEETSDNPIRPKPPISSKIRENIETRNEKRAEFKTLEERKEASTSSASLKAPKPQLRANATTSIMFKRNAERKEELSKKMEARLFEARKNNLERTLDIAISNLESLTLRIQTKITKAEAEGKDMTEAKAKFAEAKTALVEAKAEVEAFESLDVSISTSNGTTTTEVELGKPRELGDNAIKAVKEARDAMKEVVEAIAHSLGVKVEAHVESN